MKTVLTIAGSDASGGAGIQADIKTLTVHKVYATSCITALTAQNTKGITGIMPVPPDFLKNRWIVFFRYKAGCRKDWNDRIQRTG